jgi:predicted GIY-YIG superfamily endonuclease
MPVTVYALRFESGEIYTGMTSDLNRRLEEHRRRQSPSTRKYTGDFSVIYTQEFADHRHGRSHETYMKSGVGRRMLQNAQRPGSDGASGRETS